MAEQVVWDTVGTFSLLIIFFFGSMFLFGEVIIPMINRLSGTEVIRISAERSSTILQSCQDYHSKYFSPDYDYKEEFRGLFPESWDPYRQTKFFCGALLTLERAISRDTDLEAAVRDVNESLGMHLQYETIQDIVEGRDKLQVGEEAEAAERKEIWLQELETLLVEEVRRMNLQ